jgi:toxin ParE1/3/4
VKKYNLIVSDSAVADILDQGDWYALQSGPRLSNRWERAVTNSLLKLTKHPRTGSLCKFKVEEIRDVRRTPIPGFPKHLIFYRIDNEEIFILRVLHRARDLESLF